MTGDEKEAVEKGARHLAENCWEVREQCECVAPTDSLEAWLAAALKSDKKPYFIRDMGDNPTAGGAGDVTWTLTKLLARPEFKKAYGPTLIYASIPGPELVAQAKAAGEGGQVSGRAGALVDKRQAPHACPEGQCATMT